MILLTTKCLSMVSCDIPLQFPPFYITRFSFLYSRCSSVAMIYFQTDLFTIGNLVEVLSVSGKLKANVSVPSSLPLR